MHCDNNFVLGNTLFLVSLRHPPRVFSFTIKLRFSDKNESNWKYVKKVMIYFDIETLKNCVGRASDWCSAIEVM